MSVDVCDGGCGGIWLDAFELQQVDEQEATVGFPLLHIRRDPQVTVDFTRKRECPRCEGIKLHRHYFSAKRRVEVDLCPNCAGYWLDAGELELVLAEQAETAQTKATRQSTVAGEFLRHLARLEAKRDKSAS